MRITHDPSRHTGHRHGLAPADYVRRAVADLLWPSYECQLCVGQEYWQGCECAYHGAVAPGFGPERWRAFLRRVLFPSRR